MKVEIWSDVICPWCGLGQHRLDTAIGDRSDIELVHRSFELDPHAPAEPRPAREMLSEKYRVPEEQLGPMFARVEALAAADGLRPYVVGDNQVGNTHLAHELLALAADRGVAHAAWQAIYRAYFGARRSIFDVDALVALAPELGVDAAEARAALTDRRYRDQVDADGREARSLGASGVPFIVVDRRIAIAGAQPVDVLRRALDARSAARPSPG